MPNSCGIDWFTSTRSRGITLQHSLQRWVHDTPHNRILCERVEEFTTDLCRTLAAYDPDLVVKTVQ